jgi:hypothetical protein
MPRQPGAAAWALVAISAFLVALTLHRTPDRGGAAWVVPFALVWAFAAPSLRLGGGPWRALAVGAALRGSLVGTSPWLSDDVYRYLWEGRLLAAGGNPFAVAPKDVVGLDDALADLVNHGDMTSIYPPLALLWFRLIDALGGTVLVAQVATSVADLLTVALLWRFVGARASVLWAVHPIPVIEAAHGAHIDLLAVPFAVAAVGLGRPGLAVLGGGIKLFPALLVAWLPRRMGEAALAAAGVLAASGPWWTAGATSSARTYAATWAFNGALYPGLSSVLGGEVARVVLVGLASGMAVAAWRRAADAWSAWFGLGLAFLVTSPTAHPWYGVWLLAPAVALGRDAWVRALAWLMCGYGALAGLGPDGSWVTPAWVWPSTWVGGAFVLLASSWWSSRSEAPPTQPSPAPNSATNGTPAHSPASRTGSSPSRVQAASESSTQPA